MLKAVSLVRSYGDFRAVDNVSFTISPGQIVGLLGHNGAGKTTIMKMLTGHLEPDSGYVELNDERIDSNLLQFQSKLGYLPESLPIYPEMVVADYLDYICELKGLAPNERVPEVKRVVNQTSIEEKLFATISSLSRGFKQRVGVAQAILGKPKILILDEPTNGLDPSQTEQMRVLIREISKKATVILSTHIMQEVDSLCDRVLILNSGKLAIDADLDDLRKSSEMVLATSLAQDSTEEILKGFKTVEAWTQSSQTRGEHPEDYSCFHLTLAEGPDHYQISAELAAKVSEAGGKLYELRPITRNLETLVRNISSHTETEREVRHAS